MNETIEPVGCETGTPPVGVVLEVKYPGGHVGYAIWTGQSWRPRYLVMPPVFWRHRTAPAHRLTSEWTACPAPTH